MLTSDEPSLIQGDVNVNVPLVPMNVNLTHNARNSEVRIDLNNKKKTPEFELDDDFSSDYSYLEISLSHEIQMPDLSLYSRKVEPVVFKHVNPSRGVPINQTISSNKGKGVSIDLNLAPTSEGHKICKDPFFSINSLSPTVSIRPTYDLIAATSWSSKQGLSSHNQNPNIRSAKQ